MQSQSASAAQPTGAEQTSQVLVDRLVDESWILRTRHTIYYVHLSESSQQLSAKRLMEVHAYIPTEFDNILRQGTRKVFHSTTSNTEARGVGGKKKVCLCDANRFTQ